MKQIWLLVGLLIFYFFINPVTHVSAHNGTVEHSTVIDLIGHWNLILAGVLVFVLVMYILQFKKEQDFRKKFSYFFLALLVFYLALGSPLHVLGDHYLFSAHMLEQSLIYIVLPPLLLLSLPNRFAEPIFRLGLKVKIIRFLKKPLIPLLLFNVLFSFYHIPQIFNEVVSNNILHNLAHITLTVTALFMWIPLIPVIEELNRLSEVQKIGYIFGAGILLTPACALIIFSNEPFYTVYAGTPELLDLLPPIDDQQTGGIIMKVIQELVFGTMIGYLFFKWARKERLKDDFPDKSVSGGVNQ
ncbi:cytochrome c oxidase assembly factor CtaG [Aeromicrobium ponti]|uniref:Putative membrane protein n=1 Tax=Cytobacillus oceanisediminis TaxID=665099 RepID=A0A562JCN0_9BACI|nr:cytochrome c oxidase assembly protein [Cytobacillus oceanisediminis]TWH80863.1 putative membrane protein [Cytobacillus oceanisediminis]